jgi:prepilin-type N-terminal cleavage/methylation domain-containing protein
MRALRQSDFRLTRGACGQRSARRGFTLIELIFVLVILAITAVFAAASMGRFFRGRALNFEARRLLSLTHFGQSRAVSEGVPMILWINPEDSTYGLSVQSTFNDPAGDPHAVKYTADPSLRLETPAGVVAALSEQDDEKLGVTEGLAFIRFNPDGFFDESSVGKIMLQQGAEAGLELVPTSNRLGYQILPASHVP